MQPDELKALRKQAGMSQGEFAQALGMSVDSIGRMESGLPGYPIERRTELAAIFVLLSRKFERVEFFDQHVDLTRDLLARAGLADPCWDTPPEDEADEVP
jgi:transcriptional regulator with XRE-family HTH domain